MPVMWSKTSGCGCSSCSRRKGTWIESGNDYKKYLRDNNKMPAHEAEAESKIQKKNITAADDKKRRDAVIKVVTQQAP